MQEAPTKEKQELIYLCTNCEHEVPVNENTAETRTLNEKVDDVGSACPECGEWLHFWYEDQAIKQMRDRLQLKARTLRKVREPEQYVKEVKKFKKYQAKFTAVFDDLQTKVKGNLIE